MARDTLEELIQIAIEFFLISIFLLFVIRFNGIRRDFASTKNTKIETAKNVVQSREFSKYQTGYSDKNTDTENYKKECLYADDVVEAIRNYRNGDIEIYVDQPNSSSGAIHLTKKTAQESPSLYSYETLTSSSKEIDADFLFHPYLIYNGCDASKSMYYNNKSSGTVTGIAFIRFIE